VFHPVQPDWVGKKMSELRDMNGKPTVQLVAQVCKKEENDASDWVFYLWPDKTQLILPWKSAYVRKVVTPSGKTYVIGSGVYEIKMEKAFVEERVQMAGELLETRGKDVAFQEFVIRFRRLCFLAHSYSCWTCRDMPLSIRHFRRRAGAIFRNLRMRSAVVRCSRSWRSCEALTKHGCSICGPSPARYCHRESWFTSEKRTPATKTLLSARIFPGHADLDERLKATPRVILSRSEESRIIFLAGLQRELTRDVSLRST
jgi:hypothetical protein